MPFASATPARRKETHRLRRRLPWPYVGFLFRCYSTPYKASYAFRERIDIDGFRGPQKMFDLTEELIRRRYSDDNIRAVLGGNFRRLLASTWK